MTIIACAAGRCVNGERPRLHIVAGEYRVAEIGQAAASCDRCVTRQNRIAAELHGIAAVGLAGVDSGRGRRPTIVAHRDRAAIGQHAQRTQRRDVGADLAW